MKNMVLGFVNSISDTAEVAAIGRFAEENGLEGITFIETSESKPLDWKSRILVRTILSCKRTDHVIVESFISTRLDVVHLFEVLDFCEENGIFFHSIEDGFCTCVQEEGSLTVFRTLKVARDLDLNDMKRRSNLDTTKPRKGRPLSVETLKLDQHRKDIKAFRAKGYTLAWIADYYGVSQFTIKNWAARPANKA